MLYYIVYLPYTYISSLLGRSIRAIFYLLALYRYNICLYFTTRMLGTNEIYIFKIYSEIVIKMCNKDYTHIYDISIKLLIKE